MNGGDGAGGYAAFALSRCLALDEWSDWATRTAYWRCIAICSALWEEVP